VDAWMALAQGHVRLLSLIVSPHWPEISSTI